LPNFLPIDLAIASARTVLPEPENIFTSLVISIPPVFKGVQIYQLNQCTPNKYCNPRNKKAFQFLDIKSIE
jgi:hypothetical protein